MIINDEDNIVRELEDALQTSRSELMTKKVNYSSKIDFDKWLKEVYLRVVLVSNKFEQFSSTIGMTDEQMSTLTNLCDNQILSINIKHYS